MTLASVVTECGAATEGSGRDSPAEQPSSTTRTSLRSKTSSSSASSKRNPPAAAVRLAPTIDAAWFALWKASHHHRLRASRRLADPEPARWCRATLSGALGDRTRAATILENLLADMHISCCMGDR